MFILFRSLSNDIYLILNILNIISICRNIRLIHTEEFIRYHAYVQSLK